MATAQSQRVLNPVRHLQDIGRWCARGAIELATIYLVIVLACAALFAMFEQRSLGEAVYWAFTTAMTVGYGDISPTTAGARLVAVVLMHFAPMLVIPLLTARLASQLIVDNDAFTHGEQEDIKAALRRIENQLERAGD